MGTANSEQYPAVRAMTICLACGGGKHVGLLVCWSCHNELKMNHDFGYGPMDRVIQKAQSQADQHQLEC